MAYIEQLSANSPDGSTHGKDATIKAGMHGVAVVQRAGAAQSALTVVTLSLGGYGWATSVGAEAAHALLVEIRAALVEKGIIKGTS